MKEVCEAAGIKLAYLPPYSPDLNPIEEAFAELKAYCKKHRSKANDMGLEEFLNYVLENIVDGARGHFSQCMVGKPIRDGPEEDYWHD